MLRSFLGAKIGSLVGRNAVFGVRNMGMMSVSMPSWMPVQAPMYMRGQLTGQLAGQKMCIPGAVGDLGQQQAEEMHADSVMRKRRTKMKKHKLRKRRKRQKAEKRKQSQG